MNEGEAHYHMETDAGPEIQADWESLARITQQNLSAFLRHQGMTPDHAPELPPLPSIHSGIIDGPFRLLCAYKPFGAIIGYENDEPIYSDPYWCVRVDTIVKKP